MDAYAISVLFLAAAFLLYYPLERKMAVTGFRKMSASYFLDIEYAFLILLLGPLAWNVFLRAGLPWPGVKTTDNSPFHVSATPLPFIIGFPLTLFLYDAANSVRHRFFHMQTLWAFHSIHHSAEEVNWISSLRFHPAEAVITILLRLAVLSLLYAAGVADGAVLVAIAFFLYFYDAFIHANCRWTFGPLRFLFASPVYHRWHHSALPEARDKNFASVFPVIDMAMGTYYMPPDKLPLALGIGGGQGTYPESLWQQLLYPFRRKKTI